MQWTLCAAQLAEDPLKLVWVGEHGEDGEAGGGAQPQDGPGIARIVHGNGEYATRAPDGHGMQLVRQLRSNGRATACWQPRGKLHKGYAERSRARAQVLIHRLRWGIERGKTRM